MTVPTELVQAAHPLRSGEWIWFYAIQVALEATVAGIQAGTNEWVCLTSRNQQTSFAGVTWYPWPVEHTGVEVDSEGNLPETSLTLANHTDLPARILRENDGLEGMRVLIILTKASLLANPEYASRESFDIIGAEIQKDTNAVMLRLGQGRLHTAKFPPHRFLRNGCRYRFKGPECGYTGSVVVCDLTLDGIQGCASKSNQNRFGGAPNIPEQV